MDAKLISVSSKGLRKVFPLGSPVTTLGRQPDCDLQVPLVKISRQHCQFKTDGDRVSVKDLGSANGTFVNGKKISQEELLLNAGDIISLAEAVNFLIQIDGKPATIDESKLRQGSPLAPAATASAPTKPPPQKPKPTAPISSAAVKAPLKPVEANNTDELLGESFFKDIDEDEEEAK